MSTARPWCCYIDPDDDSECQRIATWGAYWYDDRRTGDDTQACDKHLVHLIPHDRSVEVWGLEVNVIDLLAGLA